MYSSSRQIGITLRKAAQTAIFTKSKTVGLEHLAFALIQPGTNASSILASSGVNVERLISAIAGILFVGPHDELTRHWRNEGVRAFQRADFGATEEEALERFRNPVNDVPEGFGGPSELVLRVLEKARQIKARFNPERQGSTAYIFLSLLSETSRTELEQILIANVSVSTFEQALMGYCGAWEE